MSHLRPRAFAAVLAAAAVVLTCSPANAERQTTTDARRDVIRLRTDGTVVHERDNKAHDVVKAGAVHRGRTLQLWVQVRRLAADDYIANWFVQAPQENWEMHFDKEVGPAYTSLFHAGGPEVPDCEGLRGRALPRRDRVVVTVPRACIGNPRWIRFGNSVGHEAPSAFILDEARIDSGFDVGCCRLGPRVRHN